MATPVSVHDLTFGVEFEVLLPESDLPRVGGYHSGIQVPQLPVGWKAEHDGSLRCEPGFKTAEIVSPILKGADGLQQIKAVCDWFVRIGAKVNRSTGFHVHVGWQGDEEALKRLVFLVSNFEKALYASTGTRTREQGIYCNSVQNDRMYQHRFVHGTPHVALQRYHCLNLTNLGSTRKQTVEFRVFAGTTNVVKAIGYVRLCLGIVEKALNGKRAPKWVAKTPVETSPVHRKGGEGQTALARLFYGLGWTKGREDHTFGDVQGEALPGIKETKKELMRLAKKYDQNKA